MMPLVYQELRRIGRNLLKGERIGHTLPPTAIVNEAYLRLARIDIKVRDRAHCMLLLSQTMRRVLIDHGRSRRRAKRELPSPEELENLVGDSSTPQKTPIDVCDIDIAMDALAAHSEQAAQMTQLRYFFGVEDSELAALFNTSEATVTRTMRFAKAWLANYVNTMQKKNAVGIHSRR